jgi:anti-sigma B factor antagonist
VPGVELNVSVRGGLVVLALRGDLDVTGAADAEAAITALVARGRSLIIDMSALDFIDCCSLGALLRVQALAWCGGGVVLAAPQRHVLRLLALTGNAEAFPVHATVAGAAAGIASSRRRYAWRRLAVRTARHGRAALSRTGTGLSRPGQWPPWRVPCADDGNPDPCLVGAGGRACRRARPAGVGHRPHRP